MATETWVLNETLTGNLFYWSGDTNEVPDAVKKAIMFIDFASNNEVFFGITMTVGTPDIPSPVAPYAMTRVYSRSGSSWTDQAYRTVTFDEPVTDTTLLTWLQSNGTKQEVTVTLEAGTYKWVDEPVVRPETNFEEYFAFVSNDQAFSSLIATGQVSYDEELVYDAGWINEAYKTIILATNQTVSAEFYNWAITQGNLVKQETPPTKLSYDLSTSSKWAALADGEHQVTIVAKGTSYQNSEPSAAVSVAKPTSEEGGDLVMSKGERCLFSMNESSDINMLSGSFAGTPTFYTTNNNANTIHLKSKGYDLISKINDVNNANPPTANEFFTVFGITATNKGTSLAQRHFDFMTPFSSRLSTTEGTDGGEFSSWGLDNNYCEAIKDCAQEDLLLVVYDSLTDTAQAFELDDYDSQYGTFTTSAVVGYNTMAAFVVLETNPDIVS